MHRAALRPRSRSSWRALAVGASLAAGLGLGEARAEGPGPSRVIQQRQLLASQSARVWDSRPLSEHRTVYVHLYRRGREIAQHWISGCSAFYVAGSLFVRLTVRGCKLDRYIVRLRYVSLAGRLRFRVRLTSSDR